MDAQPPPFEGILETVLYYGTPQREQIDRFYSDVLGLKRLFRWDDGFAYRVGAGVLLAFDRQKITERDEPQARHGATGSVHSCLLAPAGGYENWKAALDREGVEIEHEERWPGGSRSFYFRDPAGNLLEIADADLWPR
jgi:catechol 2,3-dioxygenase-like lactoylglutathione lyase family enzyme